MIRKSSKSKSRTEKRAYIVPVQYMMPVTVYVEEIATTARAAERQVRRRGIASAEDFAIEAKLEVTQHNFIGGKVRVFPGERSGNFHSEQSCSVCLRAKGRAK